MDIFFDVLPFRSRLTLGVASIPGEFRGPLEYLNKCQKRNVLPTNGNAKILNSLSDFEKLYPRVVLKYLKWVLNGIIDFGFERNPCEPGAFGVESVFAI